MNTVPFIDLKPQYQALKQQIDSKIMKVLEHGQFILGPEVKECEKDLAKFVGVKHALTCSNGTDALQIAMMAVGFQPGDEIITTPFTFVATAEVPVLMNVNPVFVDIEMDTYNLKIEDIEKKITKKTKAIMPVSLYGQMPDMNALMQIAEKHKLFIIEDGAQSFGAEFDGKKSGSFPHIGCTSFFPAKPLGCFGDGGAVFTDNDEFAKAMEEIRTHGQSARYHHSRIGMNGRLDTIQCAVLTEKLKRFPWELDQRNKYADRYFDKLKQLEPKIKLPRVLKNRRSAWAQYTIMVDDRENFAKHLQSKGVPTSVHYPTPVHQQPAYKQWATEALPNAEKAAKSVISLPMYPDMTDAIQDQVVEAILSFYR